MAFTSERVIRLHRRSLSLYVCVPVKLGSKGIEQIIQIKLTPEEKVALDKSAEAVKGLVAVIGV